MLDDKQFGKVEVVGTVKGASLLGAKLAAPYSKYEHVYALPMMSIKANKGTGVVTSVPSDSPDDFAALRDLKNKAPLREKYGIKDEMVMPFEPVSIIDTPGMGDLPAPKIVEEMKIQSQNDADKLQKAKELVYKAGFYDGVLKVGAYKGTQVQDCKKKVQTDLVKEGLAVIYYEPEGVVLNRSGDEALVALCDQWFLDYGEASWKDTISNWLIESLSDSTIYMAYYTVAHLLQDNSLDGQTLGSKGIKPEEMSPAVWDYIFLGQGKPAQLVSSKGNSGLTKQALELMRKEFCFWYGVDLRASGKDLIPNHLTYYIYNHMSKSTGNFLTLHEAVDKYSADGLRLALADAGDSLEDANIEESMCEAGLLNLYSLLEWMREQSQLIARDRYKEVCQGPMHVEIIKRYMLVQTVLLSPICAHVCQHLWSNVLGEKKPKLVCDAAWPTISRPVDEELYKEGRYIDDVAHKFRLNLKALTAGSGKGKKAPATSAEVKIVPTAAIVWIANEYPSWQRTVIKVMRDSLSPDNKLPANDKLAQLLKPHMAAMGKNAKMAMSFSQL
ncbi:hypothetical protein Ciccas_013311, partial [Cichlidogyrus casuarinus]